MPKAKSKSNSKRNKKAEPSVDVDNASLNENETTTRKARRGKKKYYKEEEEANDSEIVEATKEGEPDKKPSTTKTRKKKKGPEQGDTEEQALAADGKGDEADEPKQRKKRRSKKTKASVSDEAIDEDVPDEDAPVDTNEAQGSKKKRKNRKASDETAVDETEDNKEPKKRRKKTKSSTAPVDKANDDSVPGEKANVKGAKKRKNKGTDESSPDDATAAKESTKGKKKPKDTTDQPKTDKKGGDRVKKKDRVVNDVPLDAQILDNLKFHYRCEIKTVEFTDITKHCAKSKEDKEWVAAFQKLENDGSIASTSIGDSTKYELTEKGIALVSEVGDDINQKPTQQEYEDFLKLALDYPRSSQIFDLLKEKGTLGRFAIAEKFKVTKPGTASFFYPFRELKQFCLIENAGAKSSDMWRLSGKALFLEGNPAPKQLPPAKDVKTSKKSKKGSSSKKDKAKAKDGADLDDKDKEPDEFINQEEDTSKQISSNDDAVETASNETKATDDEVPASKDTGSQDPPKEKEAKADDDEEGAVDTLPKETKDEPSGELKEEKVATKSEEAEDAKVENSDDTMEEPFTTKPETKEFSTDDDNDKPGGETLPDSLKDETKADSASQSDPDQSSTDAPPPEDYHQEKTAVCPETNKKENQDPSVDDKQDNNDKAFAPEAKNEAMEESKEVESNDPTSKEESTPDVNSKKLEAANMDENIKQQEVDAKDNVDKPQDQAQTQNTIQEEHVDSSAKKTGVIPGSEPIQTEAKIAITEGKDTLMDKDKEDSDSSSNKEEKKPDQKDVGLEDGEVMDEVFAGTSAY